jgi:hypothetical protein
VASRRLLLSLTGLAAAGVYLAGAWLTGHLDPLAGRPVLDGFAPPPPYRWASPPPSLAATNVAPAPVTATVRFSGGGSDAGAVSTPDLQGSVFLVRRSLPPAEGQREVTLTIEPRVPEPSASTPDGFDVAGNVYAFVARYEPGGSGLSRLLRRARVVLIYPGPPPSGRFEHVLLASRDGKSWRALPTSVATAQHQAAADVIELGYFAVGRRAISSGGLSESVRVGVFLMLLLAAAAAAFLGWRGRRRPAP